MRPTTLYTLSYLIPISSPGTKYYLLFPSSQMGKLRCSRLRPVSHRERWEPGLRKHACLVPFPSSMWTQSGRDGDAIAVVQRNKSRDIYVKEIG